MVVDVVDVVVDKIDEGWWWKGGEEGGDFG